MELALWRRRTGHGLEVSNQYPVLDLTEAYEYGKFLRDNVRTEMPTGKPIMCPEDAGLLSQIIYNSRGNDHLEIGSACGGSAIITLKAMSYCGRNDKIVCIDPFGEDPYDMIHKAVEHEFWANIKHFGFEDRVEHIKAFSHPFPIQNRRFATAFIDGDHSYECVLNDWNNLKGIVDNYIMFHDYGKVEIRKVIDENVAPDKDWLLAAIHGWSAVFVKTTRLQANTDWFAQAGSNVGDYSQG